MKKTAYLLTALLSVSLISSCVDESSLNGGRDFSFKVITSPSQTAAPVVSKSDLSFNNASGSEVLVLDKIVEDTEMPASKAVLVESATQDDFVAAGFGLYAFDSKGTTVIDGEKVTRGTDGYWKTAAKHNWNNTETLTFIGYYPKDLIEPAFSAVSATNAAFSYSVPLSSDDQKDLLLSYLSETGSNTLRGYATLNFTHPLTAVKFKINEMLEVSKVNTVKIEGVYASGVCTPSLANPKITEYVWNASEKTTVSGGAQVTITDNEAILGQEFVFALIPQTFEKGDIKITMNVTTKDGDVDIVAVPEAGSWEAGKTTTYAVSADMTDWTYVIEVEESAISFSNGNAVQEQPVHVKSYRHQNDRNAKPVKFKAEYKLSGSEEWMPFDASAINLNGLAASGNAGSIETTEMMLSAGPKPIFVFPEKFAWENESSTASNVDLSMFDVFSGTVSGSRTTANCYVVAKPGSYKFPCVYGNSIVNGAENPGAYKTDNQDVYVLSNFVNCDGQPIKSSYILEDVDASNVQAKLVWQDAFESNPKFGEAAQGLITKVGISGVGKDAFITFETADAHNLVEGNAVIALCDGDKVLWSWHIWVTKHSLSDCRNIWPGNGRSYFVMPVPLGYCKGVKSQFEEYESLKEISIRLVQEGQGGQSCIFTVSRPNVDNYSNSGAPFYQWGRKDPMMALENEFNKIWYEIDGTPHTEFICASDDFYPANDSHSKEVANEFIALTIQNPQLYSSRLEMDNCYLNLWSVHNTETSGSVYNDPWLSAYNVKPKKTIYDPCPVGFRMPNMVEIEGFATQGDNQFHRVWEQYVGQYGISINDNDGFRDTRLFLPALSTRGQDGSPWAYGREKMGFMWTAVPATNSTGAIIQYGLLDGTPDYSRGWVDATQGIAIIRNSYPRGAGYNVRPVKDE